MLDLARERLGRFGLRVHLCISDLSTPEQVDLPFRRFCAVFSVQTLHHLDDREQAAAFTWIADVLEPGGLAVVIDRVKVGEALFDDWRAVWSRIGPAPSGTYAEHATELAAAGDRRSTVEDQIVWMRQSGLAACCLHLYGIRALIVGRKIP